MKTKSLIALILILSCLLTACAGRSAGPSKAAETAAPGRGTVVYVPGVDSATGEWIGHGGSYHFTALGGAPDANELLLRDGEVYSLRSSFSGGAPRYTFLRGEDALFSLEGMQMNYELIGQSSEGFWFHAQRFDDSWQSRTELLELRDLSGTLLRELDITGCIPSGERGFLFAFGVYQDLPWTVSSDDELLLLDGDGQVTKRVSMPGSFISPILGGDGALYLDEDDSQVQTLSRLEGDAFVPAFTCPSGLILPGDTNFPFFLSLSDGLYRVDTAGQLSPIVIYEECCLSLTGLYKLIALGDGKYFCATPYCTGMLEPAAPETLHPRTQLRFGYIGGDEHFKPNQDEIAAFNLYSPDYYIDYVDLTDNGAYTEEQALDRLNTALTNGTAPDMLSLSSLESGFLSPLRFSRQGLLLDLAAEIERDPDLTLDDIVIAKALQNDAGGLFFLCSSMDITTYIADHARFGDRFGWSFDEYLALDSELGEGKMVYYNLTRDRFLQESAASYMRSAIDWSNGRCDFDNPGFISLLDTARKLRETPEPEDPEDMIFWDPTHIFDGTQITEIIMITNVGSIAAEQRLRGVDKLSLIGWPSPDGSCGSLFDLQACCAVFSTSQHPEGCWDFLKYSLLHASGWGLPVYRPLIEEQLAAAQEDVTVLPQGNYAFKEPLTAAEAEQFRDFLSRIEHTSFYDRTAMEIIRQECEAFFNGVRSAEETASLIQSRLSLYVAEQS